MAAHSPDVIRIGMSMEDFIHASGEADSFELIGGERIPKLPPISEHSELARWLYDAIRDFERRGVQIRIFFETTYVLVYGSDWVTGSRIPDIMVYRAERLDAYKKQDASWREKPYVLVPDLCVEIISPNDLYSEVDAKVNRYLEDGVSLIWVLNPRTRSIVVYRSGEHLGEIVRLVENDTLDGGQIVPGFSVSVKDVFAVLTE